MDGGAGGNWQRNGAPRCKGMRQEKTLCVLGMADLYVPAKAWGVQRVRREAWSKGRK